ncbi:MAG: N-6 DNA methylase [Termitinemataceae bacterium]|nr:MAG: N-6 DNA methylase [Termitinemataceae bacterium]
MKVEDNLLDTVIDKLDFNNVNLYSVSSNPKNLNAEEWLNKSDWISAASEAGAEKIYFVENTPSVIFARSGKGTKDRIDAFNRIWCLGRPRILFLESDGEVSVIDLAQPPIHYKQNDISSEMEKLSILKDVKNELQKLQCFNRDNVESGKVFEDSRFGDLKNRADRALISNLHTVRSELIKAGLTSPCAHSLIARSIFIRYLEDRKILTADYFTKIADTSKSWKKLISIPTSDENVDFSGIESLYARVLQNKIFTYTLFKNLAKDFNGDMFYDVAAEEKHVKPEHLQLIRSLLFGSSGIEKKLFFYSYQFNIIPLDLISSIYEEFYQSIPVKNKTKDSKARQDGAYYTPPALVEFLLSRVLTADILKTNPRILDPACGSGIFLVESFRRIVRYRRSQGIKTTFDDLKNILGNQLVGIEVNEEAARITAFSLYLAMLNYLEPRSILEHINKKNRLPNLVNCGDNTKNHYNNIHINNAFSLNNETIGSVDVIVGNPPWGSDSNKSDNETKKRFAVMEKWCSDREHPIGDKEQSQAFLWFALDVLDDNGICAMLTSAGVLLKNSLTSQDFRKKWMKSICISEVFNFTHVRKFFFHGAISPFVVITFRKEPQDNKSVVYWSPKQTSFIDGTQSIILSKYDRAYLVRQNLTNNKIWKINWFGRHADFLFISQLTHLDKLISIVDRSKSGQGYMVSSKKYSFSDYKKYPSIKKLESRYESPKMLKSPNAVHRIGAAKSYNISKILINEGILEQGIPKGLIISKYIKEPVTFSESCYSLVLTNDSDKFNLAVLGILWSSFSRYYFFHTASNWGTWHHKILLDETLQMPLPEGIKDDRADRVVSIVKKLRDYNPKIKDLLNPNGIPEENIIATRHKLESELDAAVFDLYEFSKKEINLIKDCCNVTIPFFYDPNKSIGSKSVIENDDTFWIQNYAECFSKQWKPYIKSDETLRADLCIAVSGNIIAMEFYPADIGDEWDLLPKDKLWTHVLDEIENYIHHPLGISQILLDGFIQIITNDSIIVIKRNQKRFWTRSIAYEDAEATITKRMFETMPKTGGVK